MPPNQDPQPQPTSTPPATPAPVPTPVPVAPMPTPVPTPMPIVTPTPAPVTPQAQATPPAAQSGMNPIWVIALVVILLLIAGGAYAYWTLYMPQAAAPAENTLVSSPQDDVAAMDAELSAQSNTSFDTEVDNLENSF